MWACIIGQQTINSCFINENVTADILYMNLLRDNVVPDTVHLFSRLFPGEDGLGMSNRHVWFQQEGAPSHLEFMFACYLGNMFPGS